MRNRTRILLLALATIALTAVAVIAANEWYRRPAVVTIAVGPEGTPEHKFATKLAEALRLGHSSIRLEVNKAESRSHALLSFTHREADLAIIRSDDRKIPPNARALAILEREALILIGPRKAKIATLAELQGKKVAVVGRDARNEAFLRHMLEQYKFNFAKTEIRTIAPGTDIPKALQSGTEVVLMIYPLSRLGGNGDFDGLAHAMKSYAVFGLSDAKALQRKLPGVFEETIEAGLLSGSPRLPEEDLETVALEKILVARRGLPEPHVVELMRALFENGQQLAVENAFATRIEPPDTEKGALIAAHEGASQYVDSEVKTFFDRYSDLIYVGMSVASVLASLAAALYGAVFRHRPANAGQRAAELVRLAERVKTAETRTELDLAETEMEALVDEVLLGLAEGVMSAHGMDAFRMAHERARDALADARRRTILEL